MQLPEQHHKTPVIPQMREAESFNHAIRLERPWGWLDRAIAWSKSELVDEWRWQIVRMSSDRAPGEYIFYFDSERDYFAFSMKFQ